MKTEIPLLQNVRVAAPCYASWDAMTEVEGDRVKFCSECQKRVYNLSAMGQAEAEGLLRRHEGHLCVRYYRRTDGTILTTDCPMGLKAARALAFCRAKVSFATCILLCIGFSIHRATLNSKDNAKSMGSASMPLIAQMMEAQMNKETEQATDTVQPPPKDSHGAIREMGFYIEWKVPPVEEIPKPHLNFSKSYETQLTRKQE